VDKLFANARLRGVNALLCQGQKRVEKFLYKKNSKQSKATQDKRAVHTVQVPSAADRAE
jgi:hypothetical protein